VATGATEVGTEVCTEVRTKASTEGTGAGSVVLARHGWRSGDSDTSSYPRFNDYNPVWGTR
jgi:hypothetical protein